MDHEISWILHNHNVATCELKYYLITDVINIISEYSNGFVHIGDLEPPFFKDQEFENKMLTYQIKYKIFPNVGGIYFLDFWEVDRYNDGGTMYPSGWDINHYSFMYISDERKIYRDKIQFFLLYDIYDISKSTPSYPIYDIEKLKLESFNVFNVSRPMIQTLCINVVDNIIKLSVTDQQFKIYNLLQCIKNITEGFSAMVYENNNRQFLT
jgi:hypothetical protein